MLTASRLLRSARPAQTSRLTSAFHSSSPVKSETKEVEGGGFMGTSLSPLFAIPAGIFAAIPMIQNQWLVLDAESQLVGCFAAFVLIAYTQGGDAIAKSLDDRADAVQAEHNLIEDANIGAVQATIDAHKKRVAMIQDIAAMNKVSQDIVSKIESAHSAKLKFDMKADVERKLNTVAHKETILREKISVGIAAGAAAAVRAQFATDEKLKTTALDMAIAALANPDTFKDHPVEKTYAAFFKSTSDTAAKQADEMVELPADVLEQINAEMKLVADREGLSEVKIDFPKKVRRGDF